MYIYLPGEGKLREERDEGREEGGERERERERDVANGRTRGEIIHYILGHNAAHPKQW